MVEFLNADRSFKIACDKLLSNNGSTNIINNLIIESSNNSIDFSGKNIIFDGHVDFSKASYKSIDISNVSEISTKFLTTNSITLPENVKISYNSVNNGYIRNTSIGYNPLYGTIGRSDAYFTYINVSGGNSTFNDSLYINKNLLVHKIVNISNNLFINGIDFSSIETSFNNIKDAIVRNFYSAKIVTKDASATNISISNNLYVLKTAFINDLSINGQLLNNVLKVPSIFTIDPSGYNNNSGTLIINGDLTVRGVQTSITSSIVDISDLAITLASKLSNIQVLSNANAGIDISNVASLKYNGTNWNFSGGVLNVDNKQILLNDDVSLAKRNFDLSLVSIITDFSSSFFRLKRNIDNSYNAIYTQTQIDNSFILKSAVDGSYSYLKNTYLDSSYISKRTFDGSFQDIITLMGVSYVARGRVGTPNSFDISFASFTEKLDLSYVLNSVFEESNNSLKQKFDISFATIKVSNIEASSIIIETINTKHFSQRFNNNLWNQIGRDISNGPPLTNNNKKIAISNDGKVVALSSSSHSDVSKGRIYVYELSSNWNQLGLSSEIIAGLNNNDQLGWDIALSSNGRTVAASSIYNDTSGNDSGQVRLFELSNNNKWIQKGSNINGPLPACESGYSISLTGNGNSIAIGAWKDNSNGNNAGAVRVYDFSATINDWRQKGQTITGISGSYEGYATALSLDGQTLASSSIVPFSINDSTISISARIGQVKIFTISGTTWRPKGNIPGSGISFGKAIKLSANGNAIVIGAPGTKTTNFTAIPINSWSYSTWTNDSSIGLEPNSYYTVAVNLGGSLATVNNNIFQASTYSGSNFSIVGGGTATNNSSNNINGTSKALANNYIYGSNNWTVTLTNLTFGKKYQTTFFSLGNNTTLRNQTFNTGPYISGMPDVSSIINPNIYGNNNGILIKYTFLANTTGTQVYTINALTTNTTTADNYVIVRYDITNTTTSNISQWTAGTLPNSAVWRCVCSYSGTASGNVKFVAVGVNNLNYSYDGYTWSNQTTGVEANDWRSVCWSLYHERYVAVGNNKIMYSSNGINWTSKYVNNVAWQSVCATPGGLFAASGISSSNSIMYSSNGIDWYQPSVPVQSLGGGANAICWSEYYSRYVVVSDSGGGIYSSDGNTWYPITNYPVGNWIGICWSPERQLYLAVNYFGNVMISNNGTSNWNEVPNVPAGNWYNVCWATDIGKFIAVSDGGGLMYSDYGTSWTTVVVEQRSWVSVTWSSQLKLAVVVGRNGGGSTNTYLTSTYQTTNESTPIYENQPITTSTYESAFHFYALTNVLMDISEETTGGARVYSYQGDTSWRQLGQILLGISGGDEFGSSVNISNDGTIISVGSDNNTSNRGQVRVFAYANNYWYQLSNAIDGKTATSKAGIHALSGDGTTLIQTNNTYNSVYGINKTLTLVPSTTTINSTISGDLAVTGKTVLKSFRISNKHIFDGSINGYSSHYLVTSDIDASIVDYYSNVGSTYNKVFKIDTYGNVTNYSGLYGGISDSRLKENIVTSSPKLEDLLKVRVVNYNLKGYDTAKYIGVVAQELEELFPELVLEDNTRERFKSVTYSNLTILLIKAFQEQQILINNLNTSLEELENSV